MKAWLWAGLVEGWGMSDLRTSSYDFELPQELIASHPCERRDGSRMLVVDRARRQVEHRNFADLEDFLHADDVVVMNDAKVVPARVLANGGKVEVLWQESLAGGRWRVLGRPGKKLRVGREVVVGDCVAEVERVLENGDRILVWKQGREPRLDAVGELALPPYLGRELEAEDVRRYQTVYARREGAIAAPTAGLHFTPELVQRLDPVWLSLLVGVGTFRPVSADDLSEHEMHSERYELGPEAVESLAACKGRRLAVGTTVVRVLEHVMATGGLRAGAGETSIFLHPPHEFLGVDALLTNFHLPMSTLLMLVSAFVGEREWTMEIYRQAVQEKYRFFSYGDCMLIL